MGPELPHFFYSALFFQRDKYLWEWWQPLKWRRNSQGQDLEQTLCLLPLVGNWDRPPKIWAELSWRVQADGSSVQRAVKGPVSSRAARILLQACQKEAARGVRLSGPRLGWHFSVLIFLHCPWPLPFKKQTDGGGPLYFHLSLNTICCDFCFRRPSD